MIPYWVLSLAALIAAWALWLVRPMPRLVRISLICPILYTAISYAVFEITQIDHSLRVDVTRLGSLLLFTAIVVNAISVRVAWMRRRNL